MTMKLLKITTGAFYVNALIIQTLVTEIPYISLLLSLSVYFFMFIYLFEQRDVLTVKKIMTPEISLLALFIVSVMIGGMLVARDPGAFFFSALRFVQNFGIGVALLLIGRHDNGNRHIHRLLIFICLIVTLKMIFMGQAVYTSGRITVADDVNTNDLAMLLILSVYCLGAVFLNGGGRLQRIVLSLLIFAAVYSIILTGSRKVFISLCIAGVLWGFACFFKKKSAWARFGVASALVLVGGAALFFWRDIAGTVLFQRLFALGEEMSGGVRLDLYREAVSFFLRSPLFGVGFRNFEVLSAYGLYSHSTYAEALACTGLLGALFYFGSLAVLLRHTFKAYSISKKNRNEKKAARLLLTIVFAPAIAFLCIGSILFYGIFGNLIIMMLIIENNERSVATPPSAPDRGRVGIS